LSTLDQMFSVHQIQSIFDLRGKQVGIIGVQIGIFN
jgi:hypothetical protein